MSAESSTTESPTKPSTTNAPESLPSHDGLTQTSSPKKQRALPESQQLGEIHPKVIEAILAMVTSQFHCLANPNKLNERFWDAQIELIDSIGLLTIYEILKSVDAYYTRKPEKVLMTRTEKAARARMGFAIEYAIKEAQKEERIVQARAQRTR